MTRIRFRLPASADATAAARRASCRRTASWELRADDPTAPLHALTGWALEHGVELEDLEVSRPSLEDVYLEITGGEEVSA